MKNRNLGTLGQLLFGNKTIDPKTKLNEYRHSWNNDFEESWIKLMTEHEITTKSNFKTKNITKREVTVGAVFK
jgi:hypothetical protein